MTAKHPRIVGALRGRESITDPPPGWIAFLISTVSVYRWEVVCAEDIIRVSEGDKPGRCPKHPGSGSECWMEVKVSVAGPGYPSVFTLTTATFQEVLDALRVARAEVPTSGVWSVKKLYPGDVFEDLPDALAAHLKAGWEPFAVVAEDGVPRVWVRKQGAQPDGVT